MERPEVSTLRRFAALVGVAAGITFVVLTWIGSNGIRNELLVPQRDAPLAEVEVVSVGSGRIGLVRTPTAQLEGTWGVRTDQTFGIVGEILEVRSDVVVRAIDLVEGTFSIGDVASWDSFVHRGDPLETLRIDHEPIRIAGELGPAPAWFVDGRQDTWVVIVHGRDAGLDQALRLLPALVAAEYPVLVSSYRGDGLAPNTDSGRYAWGVEEWLEVEDAVRWTLDQGARGVAVIGIGMGGSVVSQYLHETTTLSAVRGVVFDSAVLDLEATSDALAADGWLAGVVHPSAKAIARLRFNLEWRVLDQVGRAAEFDVPILVLHGDADRVSPVEVAAEFAEAVGDDLVTLEIVEGAGHEALWNADPARYEAAVLAFLAGFTDTP